VTVKAYVRVSTADQNCELQSRELHEYAERKGWQIAEVYQDVDCGAKFSRRALNQLISDVRAGKLDCLLVWKLDRFGRSLVDCLNHIRTLEENSVRFIAVTQGWTWISKILRRDSCYTSWVLPQNLNDR